jgi:Flp pilus assembly protein TadD
MSATALLAATLLGQSAFSLAIDTQQGLSQDVAYQELSQGQSADAISKLEDSLRMDRDDPATLINLGTAYARMGRTDKALRAYNAAISSDDRYDLELGDGSWMDSRDAAMQARDKLVTAMALAASR